MEIVLIVAGDLDLDEIPGANALPLAFDIDMAVDLRGVARSTRHDT